MIFHLLHNTVLMLPQKKPQCEQDLIEMCYAVLQTISCSVVASWIIIIRPGGERDRDIARKLDQVKLDRKRASI